MFLVVSLYVVSQMSFYIQIIMSVWKYHCHIRHTNIGSGGLGRGALFYSIYNIRNLPNVPLEDVGRIQPHTIAPPPPPQMNVLDPTLIGILKKEIYYFISLSKVLLLSEINYSNSKLRTVSLRRSHTL